jgi:[ribosomal protein S5]-alanine N-acetyltransferase
MFAMITTDRCVLSAPTESDITPLTRLYTDPSVRTFLGGPIDEEVALSRINDLLNYEGLNHCWVIREKLCGAVLGLVTIDSHHDGLDFELSYQLLPEYQKHGYATEVLKKVVEFAFTKLGLTRLVSETQMSNVPSRRLLERIGMSLERIVVRFETEQGLYSLENR